jgi:hypothetical protein
MAWVVALTALWRVLVNARTRLRCPRGSSERRWLVRTALRGRRLRRRRCRSCRGVGGWPARDGIEAHPGPSRTAGARSTARTWSRLSGPGLRSRAASSSNDPTTTINRKPPKRSSSTGLDDCSWYGRGRLADRRVSAALLAVLLIGLAGVGLSDCSARRVGHRGARARRSRRARANT